MRMRISTLMTLSLALGSTVLFAQPRTPVPILVFHTDDFWLNLHHFLYVLGRHEARAPDRSRRAVVSAPQDAAARLPTLGDDDQARWVAAVRFYADGPSRLDAVFDDSLVRIGNALAHADTASLQHVTLDQATRSTLESVAPVYRKAWWPAHQHANREWANAMQTLVDTHGAPMLAFIARAYQLPWPRDGYSVRVSAYANWAGAYSTTGNLLVVASLDAALTGLAGLETVFHESMHQWDEAIGAALAAEAARQGRRVPKDLSHAMIFYTAGEATRAIAPEYVPYAEANGNWRRGLAPLKAPLDEIWKPYLEGKGTRDEVMRALVARTGLAP